MVRPLMETMVLQKLTAEKSKIRPIVLKKMLPSNVDHFRWLRHGSLRNTKSLALVQVSF